MDLFQTLLKNIPLVLLMFALASCTKKDSENTAQKKSGRQLDFTEKVSFIHTSGELISTVAVAVADTPQKRNQGLMDVTNLASDEGMLFIFDEADDLNFYMANTPLPLDILFVSSDSTIIRIHHNTTPFSNNQLSSDGPAQFVVETNGGYCVEHDIREGMKIRIDNRN